VLSYSLCMQCIINQNSHSCTKSLHGYKAYRIYGLILQLEIWVCHLGPLAYIVFMSIVHIPH
jgi:hypothetical protein